MTARPKAEMMADMRVRREAEGLLRLRIDIWVSSDMHARIRAMVANMIEKEKGK